MSFFADINMIKMTWSQMVTLQGTELGKQIKIINHITSFLDLDKQVEHPHQPQWKLFKEYYKISSCSK